MDDPGGIASRLRAGLEQHVKPREQANYIRRILALHLGSLTGGVPMAPLSLVDGIRDVDGRVQTSGITREYMRALQANAAARREFDEAVQATRQEDASPGEKPAADAGFLHEQLALLQVRRKKECLLAVERSLDRLAEKPASFQSFLDADDVFQGARALPGVPQAVLDSFVAEQSAAQPDAQALLHQLEKTALRAKLLLKQEERRLAEARARHGGRQHVSNGAKLEALNATRNELIGWMESELGKASGDDEAHEDPGAAGDGEARPSGDEAAIASRLHQIQEKYARYIAARKEILALAAQNQRPSLPPPPPNRRASDSGRPGGGDKPGPVNHLFTPYLEKLLALSRQQKDAMAQKLHTSAVLGKQVKDTCQLLSRLGEESQLLPSHPAKEPLRPRSGLGNETTTKSSARAEVSARVKHWALAADAAKIATLEAVAEAIERGQVALERSMQTLQQMDDLLATGEDGPEEDEAGDDVWLGTGAKTAEERKATETRAAERARPRVQKGDPWSMLHGDLGSLGPDEGRARML